MDLESVSEPLISAVIAREVTMKDNRLHCARISAIRLSLCVCLAASAASASSPRGSELLAAMPAWFEPNAGQYAPEVKFSSHGGSGTLTVDETGARFQLDGRSLRIQLPRAAGVEGDSAMGARSSYLLGNDPSRFHRGIPHYQRVRSRQAFPGVDVVWYTSGKQLEYDFVVAAGADPSAIRLAFPGSRKPRLDRTGDLVFANGLRQKRPVAWQETAGGRVALDASYKIASNGQVGFTLRGYDQSKPLVIDPVLYAGFLGGDQNETATAIAVDPAGNVWVTGSSSSNITPQDNPAPIQTQRKGLKDVFLAEFKPDAGGNLTLVYWTQIGGSADDEAEAIHIDKNGYIYLAGYTGSNDFPRGGTPFQPDIAGANDGFVLEVRPTSTGTDALWFSQYYGGNNDDVAMSVDVDAAGAIYIAGYTRSDSLPGAGDGSLQCCNRGGFEGFFAKILPDSGSSLAYGTFIGGTSTDVVQSIVVDAQGIIYLAGYTASQDFPVSVDADHATPLSGVDAFLLKIDLSKFGLDALIYGSYFGGDNMDVARAMALDASGGLWMAGYTFSSNLPVTANAVQSQNAGMSDLFLVRFDTAHLGAPTYSTYLGGTDSDVLQGIATMPGGQVALAGYSYSTDFPGASGGSKGADAFVAVVDPSKAGQAGLTSSSMLRGSYVDLATGVAVDASGRLFLSGYTYSPDFPVTNGSTKLTPGGLTQSFVATVAP